MIAESLRVRWQRARAVLRQCRADRRGVTIVEFAMAAPVLIILLLGIFDLAQMAYVSAALHGAVQRAARDSAIESADTATQDKVDFHFVCFVPYRDPTDQKQYVLELDGMKSKPVKR